jgi:hypothetical protein
LSSYFVDTRLDEGSPHTEDAEPSPHDSALDDDSLEQHAWPLAADERRSTRITRENLSAFIRVHRRQFEILGVPGLLAVSKATLKHYNWREAEPRARQ